MLFLTPINDFETPSLKRVGFKLLISKASRRFPLQSSQCYQINKIHDLQRHAM